MQAVATPNGVSEVGAVTFLTNSWVAAGDSNRIFFTAQPCLPQYTPPGLQKYRDVELDTLRVCAGLSQVHFKVYLDMAHHDGVMIVGRQQW